ncbi:MerR family DNA-binding transcriptional regulator [Sphingomonas oligophenolica]|uniref:MerR family transcriptional regulator n=1 Tax=Sphingomonas oligophenolica TaxID=301154 RepID=A0ABU9Y650_9SPHN
MRIGELSRRTGISASRIRFYERHQVVPVADRGQNGYRDYPETAVKRLKLINDAQQLGFSLKEVRAFLDDAAPSFPSRAATIEALRRKIADIDQHLKEVRARRGRITNLLKEIGG